MAEDVGKRLKRARQARKLSREQVSTRLGISVSAVQHHESGRNDPTMDNLAKYSKTYRISTDWIILGKGKGPLDPRDPREAILEVWDQLTPSDQPRVLSLAQSFLNQEKDSA